MKSVTAALSLVHLIVLGLAVFSSVKTTTASTISATVPVPVQTVTQTINAQPQEQITIELDQYYSFAATSLTLNSNQNSIQINQPYSAVDGEQQTATKIITIATFEDSQTSKYLIGYRTQENASKTNDLIIYFYHLYLDTQSNILTRQILTSSTIVTTSMSPFYISASFYSVFEGFISFQIPEGFYVFNFVYNSQSGLSFINNNFSEYLDQFVTLLDLSQQKCILYLEQINNQNYISLLQLQPNNKLNSLDSKQIPSSAGVLQVLSYTSTCLFVYDPISNIMVVASLNPRKDNIILHTPIQLPMSQTENKLISFQKMGDELLFTFQNLYQNSSPGGWFVKMKYIKNVNSGTLVILDTIQTPFSLSSSPVFINKNTFALMLVGNLNLINIETNQISFVQQLDSSYIFSPQQFIGNQILLLKSSTGGTSSNPTFSSISATLYSPIVIVQGLVQSSTISISIGQSQSNFIINLDITINITQKLVTSLNQQYIGTWNYISQITDNPFFFPIEKYITGSNLSPELAISQMGSSPNIKNLVFNQIVTLQRSFSFDTSKYKTVYQTDGYLSAIIMSQLNDNSYVLTATTSPTITQNLDYDLQLFPSSQLFSSAIGLIDNYGSFILTADKGNEFKTIYIPYLMKAELYFSTIQTPSCNTANFAFASDPQNGVLFILCEAKLYRYAYLQFDSTSSALYVTSSSSLQQDYTNYNQLICINGKLLISSSTQIIAYNYLTNNIIGSSISIPVVAETGKQQRVYFFRSSFVIVVEDNPVTKIVQYSYNNFIANQSPVLLRNLYIDSNYVIDPNINFIAIRGVTEYLFVGTSVQYQYIIYRINGCSSQNQFYTTTYIQSDSAHIPLINSDSICVLSSSSVCAKILKTASVSYQLSIDQFSFQSYLVFLSPFTLSVSDQSQVYDLQIVRNANTQYGQVNQQDYSISQVRTQIQDNDFSYGNTFYFNDFQLYNACILGWTNVYPQYTMINRMNVSQQSQQFVVFTILYTLQVKNLSSSIKIGSLLTIQDDFSSCNILDDQGSIVNNSATSSLTIDIYAICFTKVIKMNITFTYDAKNNYTGAVLNPTKTTTNLDQNSSQYLNKSQRIITIGSQQWLFVATQLTQYLLQNSSTQQNTLSITPQPVSLSSYISYNVMNSLNKQNLQLFFYRNGDVNVINVTNKDAVVNSIINIIDLLKNLKYSFVSYDSILTIYQFSDNQFRIQFAQSFVYEVKFGFNNNNQLIITSATLFYYKNAINTLVGGITGSNYTLLLGSLGSNSNLEVVLYDNANQKFGQYLIGSQTATYQIWNQPFVSNIVEVSPNQFLISISNNNQITVTISDKVGILMNTNKSTLSNQYITINPISLQLPQYQVKFFVPSSSVNPSSVTYSQYLKLSLMFVIIVCSSIII